MSKTSDDIIAALHRRVGVCGGCGKHKCPDRESNSTLPNYIPVEHVLAAIDEAVGEDQSATGEKP